MTQLPLIAECRVPPSSSQCYRLLQAMKNGVRLTIWNAMVDYGCGALHQRIKDLRDRYGWPIQRQEISRDGKTFAEFWL